MQYVSEDSDFRKTGDAALAWVTPEVFAEFCRPCTIDKHLQFISR